MDRKRKSAFEHNDWIDSGFTDTFGSVRGCKKVKPSRMRNTKINKTQQIQNLRSWPDLYAPKQVEELAVHKKKIEELSKCLKDAVNNESDFPRIVLLTGPAGCGKTTCLRVLCNNLQCVIREWITPVTYVPDEETSREFQASHTEEFRKFLLEVGCKPSLIKSERRRTLILIEDIPNVFVLDPDVFHELICDYCLKSSVPVFFIFSDENAASGIPLSQRLFPQNVAELIMLSHISFNPVASTFMQRALKQVGSQASIHLSSEEIARICSESEGDIRNAVLMLQFRFDKSISEDSRHRKSSRTRSKTSENTARAEIRTGPDAHVGLFNSIGRVVYAKRDADSHKFVHDPHEIAHSFSYEAQRFTGFIFHNYINMFSDCSDVMCASESLSKADIVLNQNQVERNTDKKLGLSIAVLGTMNANKHPVKKFQTMKLAKEKELSIESKERRAEIKRLFKDSLRCMDEMQLLDFIGFKKYANDFYQQTKTLLQSSKSDIEKNDLISDDDEIIIEDVESSDSDADFLCDLDSALLDASLHHNLL